MGNITNALKDWKTTVPGAFLAIFAVLSAFGIIAVPDGVQQAILVVVLFLVGLVTGGITDWKTSVTSFIIAACGLVVYFAKVDIPGEVVMGLVAIATATLGLVSGTLADMKTTVPSAILAVFTVLGFVLAFFGITIPPNLAQAVATIAVVVIALLTGEPLPPIPAPAAPKQGG